MMQRSQIEINSELYEFEIIHHTTVDRLQSLAFCLKDHIGIKSHEKMVGALYINNIFKDNIIWSSHQTVTTYTRNMH